MVEKKRKQINYNDRPPDHALQRLESWIKLIGIPLFTILTIIYLTSFPLCVDKRELFYHTLFSFVGVISIWFSIRYIVLLFRKHIGTIHFGIRFTLQLILSSLIAILITWLLMGPLQALVVKLEGNCDYKENIEAKNLYLTVVIFAFLLNTIYESFYLFLQLSEKALESERYKNESLEAQYQNLTSRLNPHFLFNSLNTLTTIIEEDPKKAVNYIRELSVVYRHVLNSQKAAWSDLTAEITFTNSYITLLKMRFEDNLNIKLDIPESYMNYYILSMTIQLLIENAVKHNEISHNHPLEIKIYCEEDQLIVSNSKQKRNILPSTTKIGLQNIRERYRFLVNREVIVEDKNNTFTVKIPLVKTPGSNNEHITDEKYQ